MGRSNVSKNLAGGTNESVCYAEAEPTIRSSKKIKKIEGDTNEGAVLNLEGGNNNEGVVNIEATEVVAGSAAVRQSHLCCGFCCDVRKMLSY